MAFSPTSSTDSSAQPTSLSQARRLWKRLDLYPKQGAIVDDPARFTICEATTKAGKTMSHLEWLLTEAITSSEGNWWWVATTHTTAEMAYERAKLRLDGMLESGGLRRQVGKRIPHRKNDSKKTIRIGGATLFFKSAEKPDNLYGEDVRGLVGDEVSRWREEAFHACYSVVTATSGRIKLIGNVKSRRNWAYRLARRVESDLAAGIETDWSYHRLTVDDAVAGGVVDPEVVRAAERDLPHEVFRALYYAEAADDGLNPFGLEAIESCIRDLSIEEPVAWGVDLARRRDWAVAIALDRHGHVCRIERWQGPWERTIERVAALVGSAPALLDSTGIGDAPVERITRICAERGNGCVEGYDFGGHRKQTLMESLELAVRHREIGFPDGIIRQELEAFEMEHTRTGTRYSAPDGMHDDCVCALALAEMCRRRHGVVRDDLKVWG